MNGYQWSWGFLVSPVQEGSSTTYLDWVLQGFLRTVELGLISWILACILGIALGVARTWPNRFLNALAAGYVEVFRNIPLLVQLFIWYFVLPELLPVQWGDAYKQTSPVVQQFTAAILCLSLFTAARVTEQVRAGIEAIAGGQGRAALALGLTPWQSYRHVLLPVGLRTIIPPLTSEFLNIFKNSCVASTIGLLELAAQGRQLVDYAARPYESFLAVTISFAIINLLVMGGMYWLEAKTRLPGRNGKASA